MQWFEFLFLFHPLVYLPPTHSYRHIFYLVPFHLSSILPHFSNLHTSHICTSPSVSRHCCCCRRLQFWWCCLCCLLRLLLKIILNGFTSGIESLSYIVCGRDLFFVSGRKKLAKPPKSNNTPITINGKTIISLPI